VRSAGKLPMATPTTASPSMRRIFALSSSHTTRNVGMQLITFSDCPYTIMNSCKEWSRLH
jgi:hypothetical protein